MSPQFTRRRFVQTSLGAAVGSSWLHAADAPAKLIASLERQVILKAPPKTLGWFQTRACLVPGPDGKSLTRVLMLLQPIMGSDFFDQVHETQSDDQGRTWTEPKPIPDMEWHDAGEGLSQGVCDTVPQWHPQTGTVLAIGTSVYYRNNQLVKASVERYPLYTVRQPDGSWSPRKRLEWDDPRATAVLSCGSSERLLFENGDVLVPVSFGPKDRTWRGATTLRCGFEGKTLTVKQAGTELTNTKGRGLLEPSVVRWKEKYYLTMRAEDGHGYVSTSDDGLNWQPATAYQWDDGEPIVMSTTQQHWLPHSDALHLVYNRKTEQNAKVFRYRAPLFIAELDPATLRLRKSTEQVLLPLIGNPEQDPKVRLTDNFHPLTLNAQESWITVGENTIAMKVPGDLLIARVHWSRPNRLAKVF
jgi:hypothetical protein